MSSTTDLLREKVFSKFHKDTWEIRTLGEIATDIYIGSEVRREELGSGDHPTIKCGDVTSSLPIYFTECISFINPDLVKRKKYFEHGDILIGKIGDEKTSGKACAYLGNEKCLLGDAVYALKHNQNPKYLAFVLSTEYVRRQIRAFKKSSTVFNFFPREIKQIQIPLPPLEIQREIVEFLDKYIELERELEMRKKQYEYYRELVFNKGIEELNWEMRSIEQIATDIYSGNGIIKEQLGSGEFPAIRFKKIHDSLIEIKDFTGFVNPELIKNKKFAEKGDLLITQLSENLEESGKACVYLGEQKCLIGNHITVIKSQQNSKFLSFYLSTHLAKSEIKQLAQKSTVYVLYSSKIKQIKIPVPILEEQTRVVEDLDKLHKVTHSFKEGIPFLIRKNKKQYEFYRELLLEK